MLPESPAPGSPAEWLRRAKSNLALAKHSKPEDTLWEDMCFNTQQAVEKAIKAVFLYRCILFPFTHDIRDLLSILDKNGTSIPSDVKNASDLTIYAVDTRYPPYSPACAEFIEVRAGRGKGPGSCPGCPASR